MKLLVNLAIALALTAAQPVWAQDATTSQTAAASFKIVDARPDKERKSYALAHMLTSCAYGIINIKDDLPGTNRIASLQSDLQATLGDRLVNETVTVKSYAILLNAQAKIEGRARVEGFAAAGIIVPGSGSAEQQPQVVLTAKCSHDQMPAGWFDTSEITDNYSPLIVEMVVTVKGKDYVARSVYSPGKVDFTKGYASPAMVAPVNAAIHKANQVLIEQIRADLAGPS